MPHKHTTVVKHEPQRVELMVSLDRPGLVILADTFLSRLAPDD